MLKLMPVKSSCSTSTDPKIIAPTAFAARLIVDVVAAVNVHSPSCFSTSDQYALTIEKCSKSAKQKGNHIHVLTITTLS